MRWGCCGKPDHAEAVRDAGFDFLEVPVQPVLQGETPDRDWQGPDPDRLPLPIESAMALLPGHLRVVGPERDWNALQTYVDRVTRRAQYLGIQRLVFGSGPARSRGDQVSLDDAWQQIIDFTRMAGDQCAQRSIILVLEHMNQQESDIITSLAEMRRLMQAVDHPAVQALLDSFHFGLENDRDEDLWALNGDIRHVHVSEIVNRRAPGALTQAEGAFDFEHFFRVLRQTGYDERISIEPRAEEAMQDRAAALPYLRQTWERAAAAVS
jgi:sugar phosphate isomerase/epimerase